eukprot:9803448-Lingulodinium_polyedra.AAC.1
MCAVVLWTFVLRTVVLCIGVPSHARQSMAVRSMAVLCMAAHGCAWLRIVVFSMAVLRMVAHGG